MVLGVKKRAGSVFLILLFSVFVLIGIVFVSGMVSASCPTLSATLNYDSGGCNQIPGSAPIPPAGPYSAELLPVSESGGVCTYYGPGPVIGGWGWFLRISGPIIYVDDFASSDYYGELGFTPNCDGAPVGTFNIPISNFYLGSVGSETRQCGSVELELSSSQCSGVNECPQNYVQFSLGSYSSCASFAQNSPAAVLWRNIIPLNNQPGVCCGLPGCPSGQVISMPTGPKRYECVPLSSCTSTPGLVRSVLPFGTSRCSSDGSAVSGGDICCATSLQCVPGNTRQCGFPFYIGICMPGIESCNTNGLWSGVCMGTRYPQEEIEILNGLDDDCDGQTDEGLTSCGIAGTTQECGPLDVGICHSGTKTCQQNGQWTSCQGATWPQVESCDGLDNDCDGAVDDGCACTPPGATQNCGTNVGACDSGQQTCANGAWGACIGAVLPQTEIPFDSIDNDCDGLVDEGLFDSDGDGYNSIASGGNDCNDNNPNVNPGADEICLNGVDDDCDGQIDEPDCIQPFDSDGDGYNSIASGGNDCNDNNPNVNPGADEICTNGVDDDCDGQIDEPDCINYHDDDGDGYGTGDTSQSPHPGQVDCDDNNPNVNPGADEICLNGVDDDCDGQTDELDCINYQDDDGDGYTPDGNSLSPHPGQVDCNDNNPNVNPGATETCNGIDDDCDGQTDEGLVCNSCEEGSTIQCGQTSTGVCTYGVATCVGGQYGSCVGNIDPQAESCDGLDNDCDGVIDNGCPCIPEETAVCGPGINAGQCQDGETTCNNEGNWGECLGVVLPNSETCEDNIDNDCDGQTDEGCSSCGNNICEDDENPQNCPSDCDAIVPDCFPIPECDDGDVCTFDYATPAPECACVNIYVCGPTDDNPGVIGIGDNSCPDGCNSDADCSLTGYICSEYESCAEPRCDLSATPPLNCPAAGTCVLDSKPDGESCTDNNRCTFESCQAGVCTVTGANDGGYFWLGNDGKPQGCYLFSEVYPSLFAENENDWEGVVNAYLDTITGGTFSNPPITPLYHNVPNDFDAEENAISYVIRGELAPVAGSPFFGIAPTGSYADSTGFYSTYSTGDCRTYYAGTSSEFTSCPFFSPDYFSYELLKFKYPILRGQFAERRTIDSVDHTNVEENTKLWVSGDEHVSCSFRINGLNPGAGRNIPLDNNGVFSLRGDVSLIKATPIQGYPDAYTYWNLISKEGQDLRCSKVSSMILNMPDGAYCEYAFNDEEFDAAYMGLEEGEKVACSLALDEPGFALPGLCENDAADNYYVTDSAQGAGRETQISMNIKNENRFLGKPIFIVPLEKKTDSFDWHLLLSMVPLTSWGKNGEGWCKTYEFGNHLGEKEEACNYPLLVYYVEDNQVINIGNFDNVMSQGQNLFADGSSGGSLLDFAREYGPSAVYIIGDGAFAEDIRTNIGAAEGNIPPVSYVISDNSLDNWMEGFWAVKPGVVVITPYDDYEGALMAAQFASYINAPLLYISNENRNEWEGMRGTIFWSITSDNKDFCSGCLDVLRQEGKENSVLEMHGDDLIPQTAGKTIANHDDYKNFLFRHLKYNKQAVDECNDDEICQLGETTENCPNDCVACNLDNECDEGENYVNCPDDCENDGNNGPSVVLINPDDINGFPGDINGFCTPGVIAGQQFTGGWCGNSMGAPSLAAKTNSIMEIISQTRTPNLPEFIVAEQNIEYAMEGVVPDTQAVSDAVQTLDDMNQMTTQVEMDEVDPQIKSLFAADSLPRFAWTSAGHSAIALNKEEIALVSGMLSLISWDKYTWDFFDADDDPIRDGIADASFQRAYGPTPAEVFTTQAWMFSNPDDSNQDNSEAVNV